MYKSFIALFMTMLIAFAPLGARAFHLPASSVYEWAPNGHSSLAGNMDGMAMPGAEVYVWTPKGQALSAAGNAQMMAMPDWIVKLIKASVDQVLKAMNLALMRIQNKNIDLMNIAKAAESIIHSEGMQKAIETGKKMKDLYEKYYDDLRRVKDAIVTLATLKDLVKTEQKFMEDYGQILKMIQENNVFTAAELDYITRASATVLENAMKSIEEVNMVITSYKTDMTDADRLILIKNINDRIGRDQMIMQDLKNKIASVIMVRKNTDANSIELFFTK